MRDLAKNVAAVALGLAVAALLAEGITRLFFDEPIQPRFVVDSGYGVRWNQARVSTRHYAPGEYDVRISTNAAGMRGPREYAEARTPGTRRVVLLGDSFTFGFGVEDDEVLSAALERVLGDAEVLNLGVSGFGQAEELVTWQALGKRYRPDAAVILYFDNDIGNNAVSGLFSVGGPQGPTGESGLAPLPQLPQVTRSGAEYLPGTRTQALLYSFAPVRWLFEHSQAWTLLRNRLSEIVQQSLLREQGLQAFGDATPAGTALTRGLVAELCREIAATGARCIVFVIPDQAMHTNFPLTADEVAALGATLVDGRTVLEAADYYRRDGHWRASGHRKAAEAIARVLVGGAQAPTP